MSDKPLPADTPGLSQTPNLRGGHDVWLWGNEHNPFMNKTGPVSSFQRIAPPPGPPPPGTTDRLDEVDLSSINDLIKRGTNPNESDEYRLLYLERLIRMMKFMRENREFDPAELPGLVQDEKALDKRFLQTGNKIIDDNRATYQLTNLPSLHIRHLMPTQGSQHFSI